MPVAQHAPMNEYVTILEAVNLTGNSLSTIRRLGKRLPADSLKKDGDKYLIKREALLNALGVTIQEDVQVSTPVDYPQNSQDDIVSILREQLRIKDEQIAQLLERQRETNILMNNLRLRTTKEPEVRGKTEAEKRIE